MGNLDFPTLPCSIADPANIIEISSVYLLRLASSFCLLNLS